MKTNIYCYIDCKDEKDHTWIRNFAKISVKSNNLLFGLLADVREKSISLYGKELLVSPRGLPKDLSLIVEHDCYLSVVEDNDKVILYDNQCFYSNAKNWVEQKASIWVNNKSKITNPDYHTHSYLFLDELKIIQERYSNLISHKLISKKMGEHFELSVIIDILEALNKNDPNRAWLTIWFSN